MEPSPSAVGAPSCVSAHMSSVCVCMYAHASSVCVCMYAYVHMRVCVCVYVLRVCVCVCMRVEGGRPTKPGRDWCSKDGWRPCSGTSPPPLTARNPVCVCVCVCVHINI
jgi:hypothetical protein